MNKGRVKPDEREKRFVPDVAVHPAAASRTMAVKGEEVQVGCRGITRTRNSDRQRSYSWDFDNKPLATRARGVLRDVDLASRFSMPRASSVSSKRPGSIATTEKSILARTSSPVARGSHLAATTKRSPALQIYCDDAVSRAAPSAGKSFSSRPGKIAASNSPLDTGIGRRRSGDKTILAKASPLSGKAAKSSSAVQVASRTSSLRSSVNAEVDQDEGLTSIQSSLHGRLSMLEGKVSQMAAELRETKELLDASNPISSKVLLTDIHSKIINIERCMTGSPVETARTKVSRLSAGSTDSSSLRERILIEKEDFQKALQTLAGSHDAELAAVQRSTSRRYSKESPALERTVKAHYERQTRLSNGLPVTASDVHALDHSRLEAASLDHAQPISACYYNESSNQTFQAMGPSLHRKLVEERDSLKEDHDHLCMKLAAIGVRERMEPTVACDEGALVAAEFQTLVDGDRSFMKEVGKSLEVLKLPLVDRKSSLPLPESSEHSSSSGSVLSSRKHRYSDEASDTSSSDYSSPSLYQSTGDATENQRLTVSVIGEFADINHLKLSDGSHLSKQLTKPRRHFTQFRAFEDEDTFNTFSIKDLRCDGSVLADEEDADGCVSSPVAKDEEEGLSELSGKRLLNIGEKSNTAGWFVCDGEGILLTHGDGCCSYYDVANMEEKAVYRCPSTGPRRVWGDCWIVQASGPDGRANKFVVAASAGTATEPAFCSWDFYSRRTVAYHCEPSTLPSPSKHRIGRTNSRDREVPVVKESRSNMALRKWLDRSRTFGMTKFGGNVAAAKKTIERSMSMDYATRKRNIAEEIESKPQSPPLWWYRPCGPLLASSASGLSTVSLFDIRDGDSVMRWNTQNPVAAMAFSSPLQWRNKSKLVLAEVECLNVWDVESLEAKRLHTVNLQDEQMRGLHIYNADAEFSGGVRRRLSSADQHSDGILCTNEAVNVLDFRVPTGIAKKFPILGEDTQSLFADGDGLYTGATNCKSGAQGVRSSRFMQPQCRLNHWSIRQGKLVNTYAFPPSDSHSSITQVWGSSATIMASNGNGLFVFEPARRLSSGQEMTKVREILGSDDLENPTFDYTSSHVLLVSKDRPAMWRHWP